MAVPSLPTALNAGDVVSNAWVDAVRENHAWFRDDRPIFKGRAWVPAGILSYSIADSTLTTMGFGDAGSFNDTPLINVGGWTVKGSDANPESLVVPEAGIYLLTFHCDWQSDSAGRRFTDIQVNGTALAAADMTIDAATGTNTRYSVSALADLAASDELDLQVSQTSGSTLTITAILSAVWMQST